MGEFLLCQTGGTPSFASACTAALLCSLRFNQVRKGGREGGEEERFEEGREGGTYLLIVVHLSVLDLLLVILSPAKR